MHSKKIKRWFEGSQFLWKSEREWPIQVSVDVDDNDPEVKTTLIVNLAANEVDLLSKLEGKLSSWLKLRKAVVLVLQLKQILLMQVRLKQYTTTKAPVNKWRCYMKQAIKSQNWCKTSISKMKFRESDRRKGL